MTPPSSVSRFLSLHCAKQQRRALLSAPSPLALPSTCTKRDFYEAVWSAFVRQLGQHGRMGDLLTQSYSTEETGLLATSMCV